MGQKLWEHPAADYWIQLTREADKAGAKLPRRGSSDKLELEKVAVLNRRRNRIVAPVPALAELPAKTGDCGKCGARTHKATRQLWRSIYDKQGGRTDIFLCRKCRVMW